MQNEPLVWGCGGLGNQFHGQSQSLHTTAHLRAVCTRRRQPCTVLIRHVSFQNIVPPLSLESTNWMKVTRVSNTHWPDSPLSELKLQETNLWQQVCIAATQPFHTQVRFSVKFTVANTSPYAWFGMSPERLSNATFSVCSVNMLKKLLGTDPVRWFSVCWGRQVRQQWQELAPNISSVKLNKFSQQESEGALELAAVRLKFDQPGLSNLYRKALVLHVQDEKILCPSNAGVDTSTQVVLVPMHLPQVGSYPQFCWHSPLELVAIQSHYTWVFAIATCFKNCISVNPWTRKSQHWS